MKRRKFVQHSALATGALLLARCKSEKKIEEMKESGNDVVEGFGLQLWSVRDAMKEDAKATLHALSEMGYTDVESAGYADGKFYGYQPKEFKQILTDLGLNMRSIHVRTGNSSPESTHTMTNMWDAVCEDAASIGVSSMICGYFDESERQTIDDYKKHAELFNKCGELANKGGLMFGHHNHDFEFFPIDDIVPYDLLLNETEKSLVHFELDHYWIKKGGQSSLEYFKKHPGRFPVWHVKDMDDTPEQFFTEVGTGIIDYNAIFDAAELSGMKYFYIEQDQFKKYQPLESVRLSLNNLKEMNVVG